MTGAQTQTLEAGIRAKTSPQRVVLRSRLYLLTAEGSPITRLLIAGRPRVPPCGCGRHGSTKRNPSGLSENTPHGPVPTACRPENSEPAWRPRGRRRRQTRPPGARPGSQPCQRGVDLGCTPLAPAPDRNVQAVEGHAVCGDVDGCGERG